MADDSIEITEPLEFHPCDTPRGLLYYDLDVLTDEQQIKVNKLKNDTVRNNEKYLAAHPEIRAIIVLITRLVLSERPRNNIHELIAKYFTRPSFDIREDIKEYIRSRDPHVYEGDSAVDSRGGSIASHASTISGFAEELTEPEAPEESVGSFPSFSSEEDVPLAVLNEVIERAMKVLKIDVDEPEEPTTTEMVDSIMSDLLHVVVPSDSAFPLKKLYPSGGLVAGGEGDEPELGFSLPEILEEELKTIELDETPEILPEAAELQIEESRVFQPQEDKELIAAEAPQVENVEPQPEELKIESEGNKEKIPEENKEEPIQDQAKINEVGPEPNQEPTN